MIAIIPIVRMITQDIHSGKERSLSITVIATTKRMIALYLIIADFLIAPLLALRRRGAQDASLCHSFDALDLIPQCNFCRYRASGSD